MVLALLYHYSKKKKRGNALQGMCRTFFGYDVTSGQSLFRSGPASGHVTSGDVTSGHMTSDQACAMVRSFGSSANATLAVPIYYWYSLFSVYNLQASTIAKPGWHGILENMLNLIYIIRISAGSSLHVTGIFMNYVCLSGLINKHELGFRFIMYVS
jgi:hypothetical protein